MTSTSAPRKTQHLTSEALAETARIYMETKSLAETGQALGIVEAAVSRRLRKVGIIPADIEKPNYTESEKFANRMTARRERTAEFYKMIGNYKAVAAELDLGDQAVLDHLETLGIEVNIESEAVSYRAALKEQRRARDAATV